MKLARQDYSLCIRPLVNHFSGDTGLIREFDDKIFLGLVDVLGHGKKARSSAEIYKRFLEKNCQKDIVEMVENLHEYIHRKRARGAAVGVCNLDKKTGALRYLSIGDITIRKFGKTHKTMVSLPGIVGEAIRSLSQKIFFLNDGDVLVLYSDGIKCHFALEDYPQLLEHSAGSIASNLIDKFGKDHDDASCIALRYRK